MATIEQKREHYRTGTDVCLVCEEKLYGWWTDYNGQIRCHKCGCTHQILGSHFADDFLEEMGIKKEEVARQYCDVFDVVPLLRDFWNETHKTIPLGDYFVSSPPWSVKDTKAFYGWVAANAAKYRDEYAEDFDWESLLEKYCQ